jgi:glycosyltransferase involved in cell wall biosynthesis
MTMQVTRVLHVIQGKHFGGAEQVVLTLAKSFDRRSVAPAVLCLSDGLLLSRLREAEVPCFHIPMGSRGDVLLPLLKTIALIRREKIDIVHTHTVRSNLIGRTAALLSGRKVVTHLHSPVKRDFADPRRNRVNDLVDSLTRPAASLYIAVSRSLRDEMVRDGMPEGKIVAIHNALDLSSQEPGTGEGTDVRGTFNIPSDAFLIVMVALLRPRKGPDVLIRAMQKVVERRPDTYLLVVGSDDMSEEPGFGGKLRRMAVDLGLEEKIVFAGFRNDIPSILKGCDLMALPSRFGEGLPMVILEAMAAGVPVIASSVEGVPEVIEDGVTGFLVGPGDMEELAGRIISVLGDPRCLREVSEKARRMVMSDFDGHTQARRVEALYRQVLSC